MPDGWLCCLSVCASLPPTYYWTVHVHRSLHWLKGIRRNEAKPFLGENVATHRFRRRRRRPTTAMLAKEKMEENKKIHSAVAEERRGGERKEYEQEGTAFKALAADIIIGRERGGDAVRPS